MQEEGGGRGTRNAIARYNKTERSSLWRVEEAEGRKRHSIPAHPSRSVYWLRNKPMRRSQMADWLRSLVLVTMHIDKRAVNKSWRDVLHNDLFPFLLQNGFMCKAAAASRWLQATRMSPCLSTRAILSRARLPKLPESSGPKWEKAKSLRPWESKNRNRIGILCQKKNRWVYFWASLNRRDEEDETSIKKLPLHPS